MKSKFQLIAFICLLANTLSANSNTKQQVSIQKLYGSIAPEIIQRKTDLEEKKVIKKKKINKPKSTTIDEKNKFSMFTLKQVDFEAVNGEVIPDIENVYNKYLNSEFDNIALKSLNQDIIDIFIKNDYLLPMTQIKILGNGKIRISVRTAGIDHVVFIGEKSDNKLLSQYANEITKDTPAKVSKVKRYLALMDKIPGYFITSQIKKEIVDADNQRQHEIDLVVVVTKKDHEISLYGDNYGIKNTGRGNLALGYTVYTPFNYGEEIGMQVFTSNHPDRLRGVNVDYKQAINSYGTNVFLDGYFSNDNPSKALDVKAKDNKFSSIKAGVSHYFYASGDDSLELELRSRRVTRDSFIADTESRKFRDDRYNTGEFGLRYIFNDNFDSTNMLRAVYINGLSGKFKNFFDPNEKINKHFGKLKVNFYRNQPLINDFSVYAHAQLYESNKTLPVGENYVVGGRHIGRGYEFGVLDGKSGYGISLELRKTFGLEDKFLEYLQPYIYYDVGHVKADKKQENSVSTLSSAGFGTRLYMAKDISLGLELARPLKKKFIASGIENKAKTKFGIYLNKNIEF